MKYFGIQSILTCLIRMIFFVLLKTVPASNFLRTFDILFDINKKYCVHVNEFSIKQMLIFHLQNVLIIENIAPWQDCLLAYVITWIYIQIILI